MNLLRANRGRFTKEKENMLQDPNMPDQAAGGDENAGGDNAGGEAPAEGGEQNAAM